MKIHYFSLLNHPLIWISFLTLDASGNNELQKGVYNGKELTVLAYQFPPLFNYKKMKDGNYTFEGFFKGFLDDIKDYYNASIKYVILDPFKVTKHGFWGALLEILDSKEVDLIPFTMVQDFDNLKHMEIVPAIWIDPLKLLQPWPEEQSRLEVTTRPFQPKVWISFFITNAIFVFTTAAFIKNRYKLDNVVHHESIGETILNQVEYVFRTMSNQGSAGSHPRDRSSYKILTGIWLLSMVVLINAYSGVLTSLLTIPKLNPIANTMKEVTERKELKVTVEKNLPMSKKFLDATEGYEKILGDQLRQYPELFVSDAFAALENVVHRKGAYPGVESLINFMVGEDVKTNGFCRMTYSPELRAYQSMVFQLGFPKGSLYASASVEATLRFWENGIIAHYKNNYFRGSSQCRTDVPPKTGIRPLNLLDLSPAFLIIGLGISLSFLCLLLEIAVTYIIILIGLHNLQRQEQIQAQVAAVNEPMQPKSPMCESNNADHSLLADAEQLSKVIDELLVEDPSHQRSYSHATGALETNDDDLLQLTTKDADL